MQYLVALWRLFLSIDVKDWKGEVAPKDCTQELPPIRCYGDPRHIYLA